MLFDIPTIAVSALGGSIATVVSSKVATWTKTKVVAWAQKEAAKVIADAKKV